MNVASTRAWFGHITDLLVGSDPGLNRLRMAASGAGAMASALGVEYLVAALRRAGSQDVLVAMLLGAVVAMMGSMGLRGVPGALGKAKVAVFFPVAIGLGMVPGIAVSGHTDLMLAVFVAVMFVAVFVRRFGMPFFFYGFMGWMGYFFSAFLGATWAMLGWLVADSAIGAAWVLLLAVTVLRTNPRRTLAHVQRSFGARVRGLASACTGLLAADSNDRRELDRARRRVHGQQSRLVETALMIEAWSGDGQALPPGWSPQALRRRVIDVQHSLDRLAGASERLTAAQPALKRRARALTRALAERGYPGAAGAAEELEQAADSADADGCRRPALQLAEAAHHYLDFVREADQPPELDTDEEFTPVVMLAMGNLPGSQAVAREVPVRGGRWNPLTRLDMTSRQAAQVAIAGALAIVFGRQLDSVRYYWAVIAALIAFTGTSTRSETFIKASNRVLGTLAGLAVGIALAHLTAGHTGWTLAVIVLSMFCGFYLIRLSYAYMIFFVTIMVSQLYGVLHEFSDQLLLLRLEETAIGAGVGIAVAVLVAPLSTRDTATTAQRSLLTSLAEMLDAAANPAGDLSRSLQLDALERGLQNRMRELQTVAAPLARTLIWDNSPHQTRHSLTLYAACVQAARTIAAARRDPAQRSSDTDERAIAGALNGLAAQARSLAAHPATLGARPTLATDPQTALFHQPTPSDKPLHRAVLSLHMLLQELSPPTHTPQPGQAAPLARSVARSDGDRPNASGTAPSQRER